MHSHKLQRSRNAGLDHRIHAGPRIQCNNSRAVLYSELDPCIHMHHAMSMLQQSIQPAHMTSLVAAQVQSANMLGLQHKHPDCKARFELLAQMAYDAARKGGVPEGRHVKKQSQAIKHLTVK